MGETSYQELRASQCSALHFYKYSVCGNIFVLVDELRGGQLSEAEKSAFAGLAIDEYFGIGCDNLIFLQRYAPEVVRGIGEYRGYWGSYREVLSAGADFVFRMFEPDGREALCCGNGLLCLGHHLHRQYGIDSARILTEVPSSRPATRQVKVLEPNGACCVNMGSAALLPSRFATAQVVQHRAGVVSTTDNLLVRFQVKTLDGVLQDFSLPLRGFLTYTGEPHLVILDNYEAWATQMDGAAGTGYAGIGQAAASAARRQDAARPGPAVQLDPRVAVKAILNDYKECERDNPDSIYCVRLLRQIGLCLNMEGSRLFPEGINVNFGRVLDAEQGIIEYRCFERGIKKETLACGTGAIAIAAAAHQCCLVRTNTLRLWPKSSRSRDPHAELKVSRDSGGGWWLEGAPRLVFSGFFEFPRPVRLNLPSMPPAPQYRARAAIS